MGARFLGDSCRLPEITTIGLRDAGAALGAMARGLGGKRSVVTFG